MILITIILALEARLKGCSNGKLQLRDALSKS